MAYVECVLIECTAAVDLLYLGACTAVAYICLPALVRSARSPVCCRPNLCTLFTNSITSAIVLAMRSIYARGCVRSLPVYKLSC